LHRPNQLVIRESITLSLLAIHKIPFKTTTPIQEDLIFVPIELQGQKFRDIILINSKINLETKFIHIINQSTQKICIQELDVLGTIKPLSYFDSYPPPNKELQSVQTFINIINSMSCLEKIKEEDSDEQKHQNQQPDLLYGPKLVKIPDLEDIPESELIKSLDFNLKLLIQQRKQLESVIK